jgi:hypothetical protein
VVIAFGARAVCLLVALVLFLVAAYPGTGEPARTTVVRIGLAFLAASFLFP